MKPPAVFISATNADYSAARRIYQFLTEHGIDCFFSDESLLRVGEKGYRKSLEKALASAGQLIVVAGSRTHAESEWVRHAWSGFTSRPDADPCQGGILTVLCDGLDASDLPRVLRRGRTIRFPDELETLHNAVMSPGSPVEAGRPAAARTSGRRPRRILALMTVCNVLALGTTIWLLWRSGVLRLFEDSGGSGRRTVLTDSAPRAAAQPPDPEIHPAAKVVREYLTMILARRWNQSADIVGEESLRLLKDDYLKRIRQAPTTGEERAMVRRVGKSSEDEVKQMTPREFYNAYHAGLQERYKVDEDVLRIVRESLTIKLLSLARESDRAVHILAQTKHNNGKVMVQNLELISLLKNGGKWQVALNEQAAKVTPLDSRKSPPQGRPSADTGLPDATPLTAPASGRPVYPDAGTQPATELWETPATGTPYVQNFGYGRKETFSFIPRGTFVMGSPPDEPGRKSNEDQRVVTITTDFWLARTECTQSLWRHVMDNSPSALTGDSGLPVDSVSWTDIAGGTESFLARLNGTHLLPSGWRFALPTEAQWEYACRAGTTAPFSFGEVLDGKMANCDGTLPYGTTESGKFVGQTTRVASYPPNQWGLYDMHGNVWEWCAAADAAGDAEGFDSVVKPGGIRMRRGGSWRFNAGQCRSASREGVDGDVGDDALGFRLVIVAVEPAGNRR